MAPQGMLQGSFAPPRARSDAAGRYRLLCVPAGEVHLLAGKWITEAKRKPGELAFRSFHDKPDLDRDPRGSCEQTWSAHAGEELAWDPVLSLGLTIRCRVIDADGKPYDGAALEATPDRPPEGAELLFALHGRDGSFLFTNCSDVPYTVACELRDLIGSSSRRQWLYQSGVRAGGPEVVLQARPRPQAGEPGTVQGRVVDSGRRVSQASELGVSLVSPAGWREATLDGDRFSFSAIPPGRYYLVIRSRDDVVFAGPSFDLAPGQRLDAGDLVTEPGTSVSVVVHAAPGIGLGTPAGRLGTGPGSAPCGGRGAGSAQRTCRPDAGDCRPGAGPGTCGRATSR